MRVTILSGQYYAGILNGTTETAACVHVINMTSQQGQHTYAAGVSPDQCVRCCCADGGSSHTNSSMWGSKHQDPPELRLLQMAEANAKQLLKDGGMDPVSVFSNSSSSPVAPASSATAVMGAFTTSQPWLTAMRLRVEPVTVRAAFSNIPAWNLLIEEGRLLGLVSTVVSWPARCRPFAGRWPMLADGV
jgi:hypothetical protein